MADSLIGRVALVTGGNKGIGRAIALAFAREGAAVAISGRNVDDLARTAAEIRALGARVLAAPCDVSNGEQMQRMVEAVASELGPPDILVNNAGMGYSHKFLGHPDEMWNRVIEVNLTGVYRVTKAVAPAMVARKWGRVINIASTAGKVGGAYIAAYTASKHGVLGLTRALAAEFVRHNITVNAICPGYVDTPMTDASVANIAARTGKSEAQARQILESNNPQGRLITPEEVAAVALMLAGEGARGITGQAINVDGGAVMY